MNGASQWLPVVFSGLIGMAILMYVVLDGYDLGAGLLLPFADEAEKDMIIGSIGPFWDANETWLVLGVGLLLVSFPLAHNIILGKLYLPVAVMLSGLIVRGVAFEFRVKAREAHRPWWNLAFFFSSLITALMQGVMLGRYLTGFSDVWLAWTFAWLAGAGLAAAYTLLGSTWLIMKTSGVLQAKAVVWAQRSLIGAALSVSLVSALTPLANRQIASKWFATPEFLFLLPLPLGCIVLFATLWILLPKLAMRQASGNDEWCWAPFICTIGIVLLSFCGLAYSVFPEVVLGQLDIWQAASDTAALWAIFWGTLVVLPIVIMYTAFVYHVFRGKAQTLTYQ